MQTKEDSEPRELELKLECEAELIEALSALPYFRDNDTQTVRLESTYFDTPKLNLRGRGIALRIRRDGDRLIQTVKMDRSLTGLAFDRGEWETEVDSEIPDFTKTLPSVLRDMIDEKSIRRLRPAFHIVTDRTVAIVEAEGSRIELALDSAHIRVEGHQVSFTELELERKSGDAKALFLLARQLAGQFPLRLSARSKSDRGYELLLEKPVNAVKAQPVAIHTRQSTVAAVQVICASCMRQLVENETIVRERARPEAIHQARVGVRRLRAAISIFKDVVHDEQLEGIGKELKWIGEQLGRVRDLDVFISRYLERPGEENAEATELLADFREKRARAYNDVILAIRSDRYRCAVLTIAAWIQAGKWTEAGGEGRADPRNKPIDGFARSEMERRWRRTRVRLKGVEDLDEEARHRVRIEMKKVRYAAEFFAALFQNGGTQKRRFRAATKILEQIQGTLGELNDIAVARQIADAAGARSLTRNREKDISSLLKDAGQQAKQFRATDPFWE